MWIDAGPHAFLAEHGWLVVRGAVPPARVAEIEAAVEGVFNECRPHQGIGQRVPTKPVSGR